MVDFGGLKLKYYVPCENIRFVNMFVIVLYHILSCWFSFDEEGALEWAFF